MFFVSPYKHFNTWVAISGLVLHQTCNDSWFNAYVKYKIIDRLEGDFGCDRRLEFCTNPKTSRYCRLPVFGAIRPWGTNRHLWGSRRFEPHSLDEASVLWGRRSLSTLKIEQALRITEWIFLKFTKLSSAFVRKAILRRLQATILMIISLE